MKEFIKNIWEWFKSFFDEEHGASTTRALSWMWLITLCLSILFLTCMTVVKSNNVVDIKLPPIPGEYITMTGLILAAKVGQRIWGESTTTPKP